MKENNDNGIKQVYGILQMCGQYNVIKIVKQYALKKGSSFRKITIYLPKSFKKKEFWDKK